MILGIEYALQPLSFLQPYRDTLNELFTVLQILLGAFALTRVSNILADWYADRNKLIAGKSSKHILFILKKAVQAVIFIFAFLIILSVFNIDLSGAIVGLGVGGIAIAFALQTVLSEFFSTFSIYFDRPFEIGDFIVVGDYSGTVKNIGIRSTRLQLLQGEELVISNKELTEHSVRNFRKLEKRRVTFNLGVTYDTSSEKLRKIPLIIKEIFDKIEFAELDRVNFTEFADYSLKYLVIYYVNSSDYGTYLDTQEKINLAIKEAFECEGIEMAFPTSTVYINKSVDFKPN
ncbi:MAG: mechanosensitive ion channel family protein [Candidatus Bathyarchaeota archaeon]|nr:mechanosensitive ion channel family protein [Candidatus Bathyarchaeota archaeon]